MKYRIKIVSYKNGVKVYYPQIKLFLFWHGLYSDGTICHFVDLPEYSRKAALSRIDNNYEGSHKPQSIEFEYITK